MKGLEKSALSVSAVAFFLSDLIKDQLGPVLIRGEISNLQLRNFSSYIRFSLKDASAKIDCLTHSSSNAAKLLKHLKDGDEVLVLAQPSYYSKYGQFSFFTDEIMRLGEGIFYSQLEQLKQKLYAENLFSPENKKILPKFPHRIGIVTSADGAALQDILRVARDRYPIVDIMVFPSLVQGEQAPSSLCNALSMALTHPLDAIIIGRGGGSSEDLSAFNDESLVRMIAHSNIPIIAAVGHEIDTSLTDLVADVSAPTPTGAAMILFPDKNELISDLSYLKNELLNNYQQYIKEYELQTKSIQQNLIAHYQQELNEQHIELNLIKQKLEESHPKKVLNKGYAFIQEQSPYTVAQEITIKNKDQILYATINKIEDQA